MSKPRRAAPAARDAVDRVLQARGRERILAADVDEALVAAGRERGDRHRFDDRERIVLHQDAILERARLRLVGVADQVVRVRRLRRARPPTSVPVGNAAPPRPISFDAVTSRDHGLGAHRAAPSRARRSRPPRGRRRGSPDRRGRRAEAGAVDAGSCRMRRQRRPVRIARRRRSRIRLDVVGRHVARAAASRGCSPAVADERRRRLVAHAEARRPHPDGGVVGGRDRVSRSGSRASAPDRTVRLRASAISCVRAARLARDVVADVHDARRPRRGREQRVERGDAPRVGGRHVQAIADVAEAAFADPADARLQRLQRGQQQVAHRARVASADRRDVRVARAAARAAIPGRSRRDRAAHRRRHARRRSARPRSGRMSISARPRAPVPRSATGSTRTAHALNSAVPDFGSDASIVSRFVATSSGKCSVMNTMPGAQRRVDARRRDDAAAARDDARPLRRRRCRAARRPRARCRASRRSGAASRSRPSARRCCRTRAAGRSSARSGNSASGCSTGGSWCTTQNGAGRPPRGTSHRRPCRNVSPGCDSSGHGH